MLEAWLERQRRFLSAWGAVGQAHGRWGTDMGNVAYATAWHHLLQEADTARWPTCRKITGRISSGNVVELLFGVMYLSDRNIQTFPQFVDLANSARFQVYADVYALTFDVIKQSKKISSWFASIGLLWKPMFTEGPPSCLKRDRSGEQFLFSITTM